MTGAALIPLAGVGWWAIHPPATWSPPAGLRVTFLDVGQGDGILLETPEGAMLVDAGPPEARVDRQLRRMGLRALAALVTTHAHRDHVGGGPAVLRSAQRRPGDRSDATGCRARGARAAPNGPLGSAFPSFRRERGATYALGRLRIRVLWPDRAGPSGEDPHLHGTVLLASYGSIDLLLTGDSESTVTRVTPAASRGGAQGRTPRLDR